MVIARLIVALLLVATLGASDVRADARRGEEFAQHWCSVCHAVQPSEASPKPGAPWFVDIAARPGVTGASLHGFLNTTPHQAMPKLKLTEQDQDDVIAYILSLRPAGSR